MTSSYTLRLQCEDRLGLVARVANFISGETCNITDAQQYNDAANARFFMRVKFAGHGELARLRDHFAPIGDDCPGRPGPARSGRSSRS